MHTESIKSKPYPTLQPEAWILIKWWMKWFRSTTWDGKPSEGDVDVILSRSEGDVFHTAAAIFVVLTRHLRLRWTLNGQAKTSGASTSEEETGQRGNNKEVWMDGICLIAPKRNPSMLYEEIQ